jgi:hypothetical protein
MFRPVIGGLSDIRADRAPGAAAGTTRSPGVLSEPQARTEYNPSIENLLSTLWRFSNTAGVDDTPISTASQNNSLFLRRRQLYCYVLTRPIVRLRCDRAIRQTPPSGGICGCCRLSCSSLLLIISFKPHRNAVDEGLPRD